MAEEISELRKQQIYYLLSRAYPRKRNGTRGAGNKEFYAELCEQPENVITALWRSAKDEEEKRKHAIKA